MDDFASLALQCQGNPPRIAARCSVFAKSDLIHLQQKGVPVAAMLYALCESIARMVVSLHKGSFEEPVYFIGGVAANNAMVKALNEAFSARNGHKVEIIVPENYCFMGALGSALLSKGHSSLVDLIPDSDSIQHHFELPKLPVIAVPEGKRSLRIKEECVGYLGVDIGSTSTKAVILDGSVSSIFPLPILPNRWKILIMRQCGYLTMLPPSHKIIPLGDASILIIKGGLLLWK
jgi:activator of 2-hydroxyglutaryl-CoA dehydratase